jgi:hypothetical protein
MKSERLTLLTTPEFKAFLAEEAKQEGVSVAELVRRRCETREPSEEEEVLRALTWELNRQVGEAQAALQRAVETAQATLAEIHAMRDAASAISLA